jgi:hypothetical protein
VPCDVVVRACKWYTVPVCVKGEMSERTVSCECLGKGGCKGWREGAIRDT